jgi:opacity protein-like surface antigen
MFRSVLFGATVCGLMGLAGGAAAADGFYVSGALGAAARQPLDSVSSSPTDPFGNSATLNGARVPFDVAARERFSTGVDVNLAGGYRFDLGGAGALRTEVELGLIAAHLGNVTSHSLPNAVFAEDLHASYERLNGLDGQRTSATANLFYDFTHFSSFAPYVGVGVGYEYGRLTAGSQLRTLTITDASGAVGGVRTVSNPGSQGGDGTYLAEVGVSIPIMKRLAIIPAYRFTQRFGGLAATNILKVGLRYSF